MITYTTAAPTSAQSSCPHSLRNRAQTECSTCGSKKADNGHWLYLTADWFHYYTSADVERPDA